MRQLIPSLVLTVSFAAVHPASADLVNGDFESGLTGWTTQTAGLANAVTVSSGTTVTDAGTINPSPTADNYGYTSQTGPGSSILTQAFTVEAGTNKIFFDIAINNAASDYSVATPDFVDHTGGANQHARFDILVPGASIDTVAPADIIVTGYVTQPGDPLTQDWDNNEIDVSAELAPYVGQDVIFRFIQVDNQGVMNLAVDNVNVGATQIPDASPAPAPTDIPTLSQWGLLALISLVGVFAAAAARRRSV